VRGHRARYRGWRAGLARGGALAGCVVAGLRAGLRVLDDKLALPSGISPHLPTQRCTRPPSGVSRPPPRYLAPVPCKKGSLPGNPPAVSCTFPAWKKASHHHRSTGVSSVSPYASASSHRQAGPAAAASTPARNDTTSVGNPDTASADEIDPEAPLASPPPAPADVPMGPVGALVDRPLPPRHGPSWYHPPVDDRTSSTARLAPDNRVQTR